jgi:hypothetical protein
MTKKRRPAPAVSDEAAAGTDNGGSVTVDEDAVGPPLETSGSTVDDTDSAAFQRWWMARTGR